jgi:hypothetical protein
MTASSDNRYSFLLARRYLREADAFRAKAWALDSRNNTSPLPSLSFVTAAIELPLLAAAQRHRELIADLAAELSALSEAQVVQIRRAAVTDLAGLPDNKSDMLAAPNWAQLVECSWCDTF